MSFFFLFFWAFLSSSRFLVCYYWSFELIRFLFDPVQVRFRFFWGAFALLRGPI